MLVSKTRNIMVKKAQEAIVVSYGKSTKLTLLKQTGRGFIAEFFSAPSFDTKITLNQVDWFNELTGTTDVLNKLSVERTHQGDPTEKTETHLSEAISIKWAIEKILTNFDALSV